jgi:hypothetical protein
LRIHKGLCPYYCLFLSFFLLKIRYTTNEIASFLKEILASERLEQLLICFDNDPDRLLPDGTRTPGAGPKATAELLATLDNPRAKVVKLPPNVKDIANLGELPQGEALLAQEIKQVYSSDPSA